jgi:hypothetical protein
MYGSAGELQIQRKMNRLYLEALLFLWKGDISYKINRGKCKLLTRLAIAVNPHLEGG